MSKTSLAAEAIVAAWIDASLRLPPQAARRYVEHHAPLADDNWLIYIDHYTQAYDKRAKEKS